MAEDKEPDSNEQARAFIRPADQLHDLPLNFRWEVTRRHPYYLTYWRWAKSYRETGPTKDRLKSIAGFYAQTMLQCIGVSGTPIDPGTEFKDFDDVSTDLGLLSGAVQPITYRAILTNILLAFPPRDLYSLGGLMQLASGEGYAIDGDTDDLKLQRQNAIDQLHHLQGKSLDSYPDAPLYYIHLGASLRTILKSVESLISRWKVRRGIAEKRVPTRKLAAFLQIWDLREGWTGRGYDLDLERQFDEIASKKDLPKSTIINRYRSAFRWITGRDFTIDTWAALIAPAKYISFDQEPSESHVRRLRRLVTSSGPSPVPESTISKHPGDRRTGLIENETAVPDDIDLADTLLDVQELISKGQSNDVIQAKLGLSEPALIQYVRERVADFASK